MKFTRKENGIIANTNAKKGLILKLINDHARYIRHKIGGIYRKLVKKMDNNGKKQKNRSKWIDKLGFKIKNKRKSENNTIDSNIIDSNIISNNTIDNNNTNDNITIDDPNETYDSKISDKIKDIRAILSRLGNIITKKDKKKIKKELYELENKNNLSDNEKKKRFMIILLSF